MVRVSIDPSNEDREESKKEPSRRSLGSDLARKITGGEKPAASDDTDQELPQPRGKLRRRR